MKVLVITNYVMRFFFFPALILVSVLSFGQPSVPSEKDSSRIQVLKILSEIDHPYPKFRLKHQDKTINNNTIHGKVVLINFWFEACAPCMAEMEALNALYKQLQSKKDFVFISISWDSKEIIKRVIKKYDLAFDVFSASEMECQRLNFASGYPTSIILDKMGIIKNVHPGGTNNKEEATKFVMVRLLPEIKALL